MVLSVFRLNYFCFPLWYLRIPSSMQGPLQSLLIFFRMDKLHSHHSWYLNKLSPLKSIGQMEQYFTLNIFVWSFTKNWSFCPDRKKYGRFLFWSDKTNKKIHLLWNCVAKWSNIVHGLSMQAPLESFGNFVPIGKSGSHGRFSFLIVWNTEKSSPRLFGQMGQYMKLGKVLYKVKPFCTDRTKKAFMDDSCFSLAKTWQVIFYNVCSYYPDQTMMGMFFFCLSMAGDSCFWLTDT